MNENSEFEKDLLFEDGFSSTSSYYFYALAATIVIGLPLLMIALFKLYSDHQRQQQDRFEHKEKMEEYREAKKGLAASLRSEVNATRAHYERDKMEQEHKERENRLKHSKEVHELQSNVASLKRQLKSKSEELSDAEKMHKYAKEKHSRDIQDAHNENAQWESKYSALDEELSRQIREGEEKCRRLDRDYQRKLREGRERFDGELLTLENKNRSLHSQLVESKSELVRTQERLREAQANRRLFSWSRQQTRTQDPANAARGYVVEDPEGRYDAHH